MLRLLSMILAIGSIEKLRAYLLYRKVSNYPEPTRSILQSQTRSYTSYIIDKAWQLQRKGVVPVDAVKQIVAVEKNLDLFEPTNESQKSLHNITLISFDNISKQARLRLQNVGNDLPDILWAVVFLGALFNIFLTWMLILDNETPHVWFGMIFSAIISILIFLTAAMDRVFMGEFSISADPYQMVLTN